MFDGLNNNRAHWNELAEVYNAKMKAIEDEKKKLEEEEARKCKKNIKNDSWGCQMFREVYRSPDYFSFFPQLEMEGSQKPAQFPKFFRCGLCTSLHLLKQLRLGEAQL